MNLRSCLASACACVLSLVATTRASAQMLETETARLLKEGQFKLGAAYEFQTSPDGKEHALPLTIEYGVLDRLELTLEPVVYTAIRPRQGSSATGLGDFEITGTALVSEEVPVWPAFAFAGEVKLPTAHNDLIGTGKTDYTAYLIASKHFGEFDFHANVAYTFVGQPAGTSLNDIWSFALAGVWRPGGDNVYFAEVLANTSAGGSESTSSNAPEAASGEVVGTLGIGRQVSRTTMVYAALSYDNNQAFQARVGFTVKF